MSHEVEVELRGKKIMEKGIILLILQTSVCAFLAGAIRGTKKKEPVSMTVPELSHQLFPGYSKGLEGSA